MKLAIQASRSEDFQAEGTGCKGPKMVGSLEQTFPGLVSGSSQCLNFVFSVSGPKGIPHSSVH